MATEINLGWNRCSASPLFDWQYKSGGRPAGGGGGGSYHLSGGHFPLEISQPQPGLTTLNRFYKAYPGLLYEVRLSVIGGYFPYSYELTTAPAGMIIDARGEITWSAFESGSPHTITAQVTDANGAVDTVTWTITVTTAGFRFIDAVNGTAATAGGDGSISNPWRSMVDWYGGTLNADKNTNPYAGEFLYWRAGTYQVDAHLEPTALGPRLPLVGDNKPQVWLAYPGETPLIDLQNAFINIYGGGDNAYFDGLDWWSRSERAMGLVLESSSNNVAIRKNTMYGIVGGGVGENNAHIFIGHNGIGSNWAIQDNELYDVDVGYGVLGYTATNVLLEDNTIHNIGTHAIGPKEGTDRWVIRQNDLANNPFNSIGLQYSDTRGILSGDMEICYNLVRLGGGTVAVNSNYTDNGLPVYTFRNTFICEVAAYDAQATNGPFYFSENVIVNETAHPEKIERIAIKDPARVITTDNLVGSAADGIVDANGELTQAYSQFSGTRGHKIVEIA